MSCNGSSDGISVRRLVLTGNAGVLAVSVVGITGTISISIEGGGIYEYHVWLSDSETDPALTDHEPTTVFTSWTGHTDSDGDADIVFVNNAAVRTWYAWCTLIKANVSDGLTMGT